MRFNKTIYLTLFVFTIGFISCSQDNKDISDLPENVTTNLIEDAASASFTVEGTISNGAGVKLYLFEYGGKTPLKLDSTTAGDNGKYQLNGKATGYKFYSIGNTINNIAALLLQGGENVTLDADLNKMSI